MGSGAAYAVNASGSRQQPRQMKPILLLLLATLTAQAATFTGKVVGVSDGDTITVLASGNKQFKIRFHIDKLKD